MCFFWVMLVLYTYVFFLSCTNIHNPKIKNRLSPSFKWSPVPGPDPGWCYPFNWQLARYLSKSTGRTATIRTLKSWRSRSRYFTCQFGCYVDTGRGWLWKGKLTRLGAHVPNRRIWMYFRKNFEEFAQSNYLRSSWLKCVNRIDSTHVKESQRPRLTRRTCNWRSKLCSNKSASSLLNYTTLYRISTMSIY